MSLRNEQCKKVCRILDDVLANRPTERDALIVAVGIAFDELEKRKTGKWVKITTGAMREKYMCSICGRTIEEDGIESLIPIRYPFCHCGAKMEDKGCTI